MSLFVHRAERSDCLVDALSEVLAVGLSDPFAIDVVAVPARGVERWLRQRLSHRLGASIGGLVDNDGVCLNVEMPSPAALFADAVAAAVAAGSVDDPWRVDALQWRVLDVIDACAEDDWAALLATHLGYLERPGDDDDLVDVRRGRRLSVSGRIARLLGSYATQRPQMLADWLAGRSTDGFGAELAEEHAWYPQLYRELVDRLGSRGPAQYLAEGIDAIRSAPHTLRLPSRLSLFGPTRLTSADLGVLDALAANRDVYLWLPHPSPAAWDSLALASVSSSNGAGLTAQSSGWVPARDESGVAVHVRNPLLRSLGRDSFELQLRLAEAVPHALQVHHPSPDDGGVEPSAPSSALAVLQDALRRDAPHPEQPTPLAPGDRSIQVHACHGRARQVEVLRDTIMGLLADDPTLQPRDILVMCPDIEAFAPLLLGAFGAGDQPGAHPGQRLHLRLADRSLRQTNPVLAVLARLLELADSRVGAAEVLDLAAMPPVQHRFGFDDDAMDDLRRWVSASHVRWGLTVSDRDAYGLNGFAEGTWHRGLDSWLLGIAMDPHDHQGRLAGWPVDGIESGKVELVGRFTEFIHRLARCLRSLTGARPLDEWLATLRTGLDTLTLAPASEQWQRVQADRVLATAENAAGATRVPLRRSDVVGLLSDELRGRPTRSSFRSGDLTACSMVPMRSVPHRVICLIGVDDGDLPRAAGTDGDNVLAVRPRIGEQDPAAEDRQLLLDAILAATDHLVVCYSGADERTGARRPPAVPLGEVLDELDARLVGPEGPARDVIVRDHPLQPFDPRNFVHDDPNRSFDEAAWRGAEAAAARTGSAQPTSRMDRIVLRQALPDPERDTTMLDLDQLVTFYTHPVRHFLRQRLGLTLRDFTDDLDPELPIDLDGLARWQIGERILSDRLIGVPAELARESESRRGALPPGALGASVLDQVENAVNEVLRGAGSDLLEPARPADVRVDLDDGRTLSGSLQNVRGERLVTVQFGALKASHRLAQWLRLLAAAATGLPVNDAVVWGGKGACARQLAPEPVVAQRILSDLVAGYDAGLRELLPLPPVTADKYASSRRAGRQTAERDAQTVWSGERFPESSDIEYARTLGTSWQQLIAVRQLSELTWPVTAHGEAHWFGRIARAVFDPLAAYEEVSR